MLGPSELLLAGMLRKDWTEVNLRNREEIGMPQLTDSSTCDLHFHAVVPRIDERPTRRDLPIPSGTRFARPSVRWPKHVQKTEQEAKEWRRAAITLRMTGCVPTPCGRADSRTHAIKPSNSRNLTERAATVNRAQRRTTRSAPASPPVPRPGWVLCVRLSKSSFRHLRAPGSKNHQTTGLGN